MAGFADFLKAGLVKAVEEDNTLGDRSTYIGASDIGGCLRKVYLDKINPQALEAEKALIFARGHLAEEIVRKGLDAKGIRYEYQKELTLDYIKAHLDFLFCKRDECIVVECKTSKSIPDAPYSSWILQIQLQMYLVKEHYQKNVRGYIVVMDMVSGKVKDFEIEYDENLAQLALDRARQLWEALQNNEVPQPEEQLYCSSCPHKKDCPIFNAPELLASDLEEKLKDISFLKAQKKLIDEDLKRLESEVYEYLKEKNINKAKIGEYLISVTSPTTYETIDLQKLKKEDLTLYNELLKEYGKKITRKGNLKIK